MLPIHFKNTPFIAEDEDGETAHMLIYVRFPPNLAKGWHPNDGEPAGAEQLLKRFLMRADTNGEIAHCLKEIGVLHNLDELRQARVHVDGTTTEPSS